MKQNKVLAVILQDQQPLSQKEALLVSLVQQQQEEIKSLRNIVKAVSNKFVTLHMTTIAGNKEAVQNGSANSLVPIQQF